MNYQKERVMFAQGTNAAPSVSTGYLAVSGGVNVTPMSPMLAARHELAAHLERLHDTISELERRLEGVARMVPPNQNAPIQPSNELPPSELRGFLLEKGAMTQSAVTRLISLLDRLEL